jgi:hypothetical protein
MPFVDITLARGKSSEYLTAVSEAAHDALVAELGMKPEDHFQLIHQKDAGEMVFNRNFRGGPRSDDWIVFRITEASTGLSSTDFPRDPEFALPTSTSCFT